MQLPTCQNSWEGQTVVIAELRVWMLSDLEWLRTVSKEVSKVPETQRLLLFPPSSSNFQHSESAFLVVTRKPGKRGCNLACEQVGSFQRHKNIRVRIQN